LGADGQGKDAGAEGAIERPIGLPLFAVEDGNAVVEGADPDAPSLVTGQGIGVIVAEAILVGEVAVLSVFGGGGIETPDAVVFSADPETAVVVPAEGRDEAALYLDVPGGGVGDTGNCSGEEKRKTNNQARKGGREKAGAKRRARKGGREKAGMAYD